MKVLAVLSLVAVCAVAADHGFAYSAYAPLTGAINPYLMPYATPYTYGYAAPAPVMAPVATVVKTQYHMQNELGEASYGFSEPHHTQSVVQDAAGNKVGSFSFVNAEGKLVQTNYIADTMGYRVESNDLPIASMDMPAPVQDTPEVAEAKAKFFQVFEETKSRARRSVPMQTPASTVPLTSAIMTPIATRTVPLTSAVMTPIATRTVPLTSAVMTPIATRTVVPHIAPMTYTNIAPLAYSSPLQYSTPYPYSTPYSYGYPYYTGLF